MAKKLVSLLCAVAMLVTMVSIAAFSASAETKSINFLDAGCTSKWNKSYPESAAADRAVLYAGVADFTTVEDWDSTYIQGALLTRQGGYGSTNVHEVDFTYNESVSLGDDFSLTTTMYINPNLQTTTTGASDTYNALSLGSYELRLVRFLEDCTEEAVSEKGNWKRTLFRVALYKDGTELGRSAILDDDAITKFGDKIVTTYYSVLNTKNDTAAKTYANSVCTPAKGTASAKVATYPKEMGYRDFTLVVKNNKLSVKDSNGNTITFVDSVNSESVDSFDIESGVFNNIQPIVRFYTDTKIYMYAPSCAMFRLFATYEAGEFVYLNANGGSGVPSAVDLVEEKPASLPIPTRNRYQFDGWFTEAEGGVEVTRDTVLTSGGTIYAHWIELPIFGNFTADNTVAVDFGGAATVDRMPSTTTFTSETFGNALSAETWRPTGVAAVSTLGLFTMDQFQVDFSLYFASNTIENQNYAELQFGDLKVKISKSATNTYAYTITGSYGEESLAFTKTETAWANVSKQYNDESTPTKTDLHTEYSTTLGSVLPVNYFPNTKISFQIAYENGVLTIKTVDSVETDFTATANVDASFVNAEVKVTCFAKSYTVNESNGTRTFILGNWNSSFSNDDEILTPSGKQPVQDEHLALNFIYTPDDLVGHENEELSASVTVGGEAYETVLGTQTYKDPEGKDIECKVVKVKCLRPDKFEDTIAITLTAGETTGSTYTYSIKQYCFNVFKNSTDDNEKQLAVDLLNYGASAKYYVDQTYDYSVIQTEATAAGMPLTDSRDFSDRVSTVQGNGSGSLKLKKVGLWLTDDIGLWFSFDKNQAGASDASLVCSVDGTTEVVSSSSFTEDGDDYIAVIPVGAVQAFKNVVFYLSTDGTTPASKEYTYSLAGSAYALSQTAVDDSMTESEVALAYAKKNLGNAILRYCDSCVKYNKK